MARRVDSPDTPADETLRQLLSTSDRRNFVMTAGAGSGKTTSLVKALSHVDRAHGAALKRNGQKVACITYTEVAADEILADVDRSDLMHVSTIHSFLWDVIRPFQRDLHSWVSQTVEDQIVRYSERLAKSRPGQARARYERRLAKAQKDQELLPKIKRFTYQAGSRYHEGILGHHDIIVAGPQLIQANRLLAKIVARRFPFIFVDESQDTFVEVVKALTAVAECCDNDFTLGFFGDPMQMIYSTGVGPIAIPEGADWVPVHKTENFRCPTAVLKLINTIRAPVDHLIQTGGRQRIVDDLRTPVEGSVDFFVLPADASRTENLARVREWLSREYDDDKWCDDSALPNDLQILVIEHRIAAERLGFANLFEAFNKAPYGLEIDFREGTSWPLQPFRDFLLPLYESSVGKRRYEVVRLLRRQGSALLTSPPADASVADELGKLRREVDELIEMLAPGSVSTVFDVLDFVKKSRLAVLDDRLEDALMQSTQEIMDPANVDDERYYLQEFLNCNVDEVRAYQRYVEGLSPYATHQGVKGEEFDRVLVVIDDSGSNYNLFSYDKLFGLKSLSARDNENIASGKDSVLERTRRLLYVCCSRTRQALAIALFVSDVSLAAERLGASRSLDSARVVTLDGL